MRTFKPRSIKSQGGRHPFKSSVYVPSSLKIVQTDGDDVAQHGTLDIVFLESHQSTQELGSLSQFERALSKQKAARARGALFSASGLSYRLAFGRRLHNFGARFL